VEDGGEGASCVSGSVKINFVSFLSASANKSTHLYIRNGWKFRMNGIQVNQF
jgi:hypothetical protein